MCYSACEGATCYVAQLRVRPGERVARPEVVLWNACTGEAYAGTDKNCPLTDVGMLVSPRNVYANLQRSGRPSAPSFSWDVQHDKAWAPFLKEKVLLRACPRAREPPRPTHRGTHSFGSYARRRQGTPTHS